MDGRILAGVLFGAMATLVLPASLHAAGQPDPVVTGTVTTGPKQPANSGSKALFKAVVRALVEREVQKTTLPADVADAVVYVESNYDPTTIGGVGEIGLMQIRPETAAMLGFKGSNDELAKPETNIHYGVTYLSKAWRLANGDLCRALMKYRAGHGEEVMSALSVNYCRRARQHLAALGSPFALGDPGFSTEPVVAPETRSAKSDSPKAAVTKMASTSSTEVHVRYQRGTPEASRAFWAAHEARVRAIKARVESRWGRVASR
jgi:Transglycosylase SLT domain